MKASEIRSGFLDYFRERGHTIVESAPVVPNDDPTLVPPPIVWAVTAVPLSRSKARAPMRLAIRGARVIPLILVTVTDLSSEGSR